MFDHRLRPSRPPPKHAANYFLDESGNTGDLAKADAELVFDNQRYFVLACVGIDDEAVLATQLVALRKQHRVQAPELKFDAVRNKPAFIDALIALLAERRAPIIVEAVDKRYAICTHIVSVMVLPPIGPGDFSPEARWVMNVFAERLAQAAPTSLLYAFVSMCQQPSPIGVRDMFLTLRRSLRDFPQDDVTTGLRRAIADSFKDFQVDRNKIGNLPRYLPRPDKTRHGKPLWMLPHLSCLTNTYARINRLHQGRLSGVRLVHDEQMQFDEALLEGKRLAETVFSGGAPAFNHADFGFAETARLTFVPSHTSAGVQAADILAGFVGDYFKTTLVARTLPSPGQRTAFARLLAQSDPSAGLGLNMVLPQIDIDRMGIPVC